jgi:hypothetical protein
VTQIDMGYDPNEECYLECTEDEMRALFKEKKSGAISRSKEVNVVLPLK